MNNISDNNLVSLIIKHANDDSIIRELICGLLDDQLKIDTHISYIFKYIAYHLVEFMLKNNDKVTKYIKETPFEYDEKLVKNYASICSFMSDFIHLCDGLDVINALDEALCMDFDTDISPMDIVDKLSIPEQLQVFSILSLEKWTTNQ